MYILYMINTCNIYIYFFAENYLFYQKIMKIYFKHDLP